jgi:chromosome segregation ATPase
MEMWLIWAAIFAGGAFGVLIALLLSAERELRRFKDIERSGVSASAVIAGPGDKEASLYGRDSHVAELERERSQLLAQIAELKEENKAKQERILKLKGSQQPESMNDRLSEMDKKVADLEKEKSQLSAQIIELRREVEAKKERVQGLEITQQRLSAMESRVGALEGEKSRLVAEVTQLKREAEIKQEKIRWLEEVQEKLRDMERRAMDLLNGLRTVLKPGTPEANK